MNTMKHLSSLLAPLALVAAAQAQSLCHSLNDTSTFLNTVSLGNAWFAIQLVAPQTSAISRIEVFTGETTSAQQLDLWSHDAATGKPAALLGSAPFSITPTNTWQGANFAAPVALSGGATYWLVWRAQLGTQASLDLPGAQLGPVWTISTDAGASWFSPVQSVDRQWKYRLLGACPAPPAAYCTAGTTSSGCNASISASGTPSASAASGFTLAASGVEGQRQGLFFYSLSGSEALPWGAGSSWLCVKAPTQRCTPLNSGGASGACDGVLALDWNSFRTNTPGLLGAPYSGGQQLWAQAWFRDPPSPKSTSLSNALALTLLP
jgi:hypothetical protein